MDSINKNKKSTWAIFAEVVYLVLLAVYIFGMIIEVSEMNLNVFKPGANDILDYMSLQFMPCALGILYFANLILAKEYKEWKNLLLDILFFVPFAIVSRHAPLHMAVVMFILCSRVTAPKRIAAVSAVAMASSTAMIMGISVNPELEWIVANKIHAMRFGRGAQDFGFFHYAFWSRQLLFAIVYYVYARGKKMTLVECGVLGYLVYQMFMLSTQRLSCIIGYAMLVLWVLIVKFELIKITNRFFKFISAIAFPAASIAMVGAHWLYSPENVLLAKIDKFINRRLSVGSQAFDLLDIAWFGQNVDISTEKRFYIDSGYMQVLFESGVVIFVLLMVAFSFVMWKACDKNDTAMFVWMFALLVFVAVDNAVVDITCCGPSLLVIIPFFRDHIQQAQNRIQYAEPQGEDDGHIYKKDSSG